MSEEEDNTQLEKPRVVKKKIIRLAFFVGGSAATSLLVFGFGTALIFIKFLEANPADSLLQRFLEIVSFGESATAIDIIIRWLILVGIVLIGLLIYVGILLLSVSVPVLLLAIISKPFLNKEELKMVFAPFRKFFYFREWFSLLGREQVFPFVGRAFDCCLSLVIGSDVKNCKDEQKE